MKEHPTHNGYLVTRDGRVFSCWKKRGFGNGGFYSFIDYTNPVEIEGYDNKGYKFTCIKGRKVGFHRLVAETFIPNPQQLGDIDHLDSDRLNNNVDNLEWVTEWENNHRAHSKYHTLITPTGEEVVVHNLNKYCRDNNLHHQHLYSRGKSKGYLLKRP